jgi:hypothetical protein
MAGHLMQIQQDEKPDPSVERYLGWEAEGKTVTPTISINLTIPALPKTG